MVENTTYAERWAEEINRVYDPEHLEDLADFAECESGDLDVVANALAKAARCLRGGAVECFSGAELDIVRHFMPAHEVHQSGAARWVLDNYGIAGAGFVDSDGI